MSNIIYRVLGKDNRKFGEYRLTQMDFRNISWASLIIFLSLIVASCSIYGGPTETGVKNALKTSLTQFDSTSSSALPAGVSRYLDEGFEDKLRDVRMVNGNDSCIKAENSRQYACDVYVYMHMSNDPLNPTNFADTKFEVILNVVVKNGKWELVDEGIVRKMIADNIIQRALNR